MSYFSWLRCQPYMTPLPPPEFQPKPSTWRDRVADLCYYSTVVLGIIGTVLVMWALAVWLMSL